MIEAGICEFTASDGYRWRYHRTPARTPLPAGYVVALHGIQSHAGWYGHSRRRLADAGYEVLFLDRRGSGVNQRDRGHAAHADRLVNDVAQFLADLRFRGAGRIPPAPVVLLGISWGGKLAAVTCARRPELVDALVLIAPGICARVRPSWHQRWRLQLAAALGLDRKRIDVPLNDAGLFTGEARWQEFIREDDLALRQATVALLRASVALDREATSAPPWIGCPTLLQLAGRDQIIENARTREWFERLPSPANQVLEYPQARHTLEFEPDRDRSIDDLIGWLKTIVSETPVA